MSTEKQPTQTHGQFKTFRGITIEELSALVTQFAAKENAAVKSVSVSSDEEYTVSIGYNKDERSYPISVQLLPLGKDVFIEDFGEDEIDSLLTKAAQNIEGDVLCHSMFDDFSTNCMSVAFLVSE